MTCMTKTLLAVLLMASVAAASFPLTQLTACDTTLEANTSYWCETGLACFANYVFKSSGNNTLYANDKCSFIGGPSTCGAYIYGTNNFTLIQNGSIAAPLFTAFASNICVTNSTNITIMNVSSKDPVINDVLVFNSTWVRIENHSSTEAGGEVAFNFTDSSSIWLENFTGGLDTAFFFKCKNSNNIFVSEYDRHDIPLDNWFSSEGCDYLTFDRMLLTNMTRAPGGIQTSNYIRFETSNFPSASHILCRNSTASCIKLVDSNHSRAGPAPSTVETTILPLQGAMWNNSAKEWVRA